MKLDCQPRSADEPGYHLPRGQGPGSPQLIAHVLVQVQAQTMVDGGLDIDRIDLGRAAWLPALTGLGS